MNIINSWVAQLPAAAYHGMRRDVAYSPRSASVRAYLEISEDIKTVDDFGVWLGFVELGVTAALGIGIMSLSAHPYRSWFAEDMSAIEAGREVVACEAIETSFFILGDVQ